jgi:putative transposase
MTCKKSYHPLYVSSYHLGYLTNTEIQKIPSSTKYEWNKKDQTKQFGCEWVTQNKNNFETLQQILPYQKLLQINRAFLKIIAVSKAIHNTSSKLNKQNIIDNIKKINPILGLTKTLKFIGISKNQFQAFSRKKECPFSKTTECQIKHPTQLQTSEHDIVKQYCENENFKNWPLISIWHKIKIDAKAFFSRSMFYKSVNAQGLKKKKTKSKRKNNCKGVRATKPLEILHADTTILRLMDNTKAYIHLIQCNYSRAILGVIIAQKCLAKNTYDNIIQVYDKYLKDKIKLNPLFVTDDGPENKGVVKELLAALNDPTLDHKIAQSITFHFSNSMIEHANKALKYGFLYHHDIPDFEHLQPIVLKAIADFNNRPHNVLNGKSPLQILNGLQPIKTDDKEQMAIAKENRVKNNKAQKLCCQF